MKRRDLPIIDTSHLIPRRTDNALHLVINARAESRNLDATGRHFSARSKSKDLHYLLVREALSEAMPDMDYLQPMFEEVSIVVEAYFTNHMLDADNINVKYFLDALVHYGIIEDDHPGVIREITLRSLRGVADVVHLIIVRWT